MSRTSYNNNRQTGKQKHKASSKQPKSNEDEEYDDEDDIKSDVHLGQYPRGIRQIYQKNTGLTNFMILDDLSQQVKWPIPRIKIDFRKVFVNQSMHNFLIKDLQDKESSRQNFSDFAHEFQNTFYTKLLYSGIFNNIYCSFSQPNPNGDLRLRFSSDSYDSFKLRPIWFQKSNTHRFIRAGAYAELHGVFGFCEKFSYQADVALLFDQQMKHESKYILSIPFLGDTGSLRMSSSVTKRKVNSGLQCKRRRKKVQFFPFEWQNTRFSLSQNDFTSSHFEEYDSHSESARLYYLNLNQRLRKLFRNKHVRSVVNYVNDASFLSNKLNSKQYSNQFEAKVAYSIPEQRFQLKSNALLKYSYDLQNKVFAGTHFGFNSKLQAECTYFKRKQFMFTSKIETGMMAQFSFNDHVQSSGSLEGSDSSSSTFGNDMPWINNQEVHNVPGYYQLYRENSNLSFFFTLRNKLYARQLNVFGFKPFAHCNLYVGAGSSKPVLNTGLGVSRHVEFLNSKIDFLVNSPNLLTLPWKRDPEFVQFQVIFNP